MRKYIYGIALLLLFTLVILSSCSDEINPSAFARRTVYWATEANITGSGGYVDIVELEGISGTNGEDEMPVVVIYGDKRQSNHWEEILYTGFHLEEGRVYIDTNIGASSNYRIVVIK